MKRLIYIIILIFFGGSLAFAETVSQKQAQLLAQLFFNEAAGRVTAPPKLVFNGRKLTTGRLFNPFYVYNASTGGFVIVSAENKAYPILGFSLKDNFDPDKLGTTEKELLRSYAQEIEYIRYDSQPVDNAEWAWQHYPEYVKGILTARYEATDPTINLKETEHLTQDAIDSDNAIYSDLYTPEQWRDMILDELKIKESVPLTLVSNRQLYPIVVYGHQGDYFRLEMDKRNSWLMRLNATDIVSGNMISVVVNPIELDYDFMEEIPFEEHDKFMEEVETIEANRKSVSSIDLPIFEEEPMIVANGGGHYRIIMPEDVTLAMIYNLSGAMVRRYTFGRSSAVNIDISAEPSGFYFITLIGESGKPYGLKLYR